MADVVEINAATGEVVERDFTPEELAQREKDAAESALAAAEAESARAKRDQERAALLDRLGITEDEAALLLGGA